MCEHCEECGIVSVEKYGGGDDELCEFMDTPGDFENYEIETPLCQEKAEYLVIETTVEDHLCAEHVKKVEREEVEADLFADSIGLGSSTLVPIEKECSELCEYFDPLDPSPEQCMHRATHARIIEFETLFCEGHLKQYQAENDG